MKKDTVRICFLPLKYYLPTLTILTASVLSGSLNHDVVGTLALLMGFSGRLLAWLGKRVPVLGEWLGGSVLGSFGLLSPQIVGSVDAFMSSGFINLIVRAAIAGSILTIDRREAKNTLLTVLPSAAIAFFDAVLAMVLGSWIAGSSILEGVFLDGSAKFLRRNQCQPGVDSRYLQRRVRR